MRICFKRLLSVLDDIMIWLYYGSSIVSIVEWNNWNILRSLSEDFVTVVTILGHLSTLSFMHLKSGYGILNKIREPDGFPNVHAWNKYTLLPIVYCEIYKYVFFNISMWLTLPNNMLLIFLPLDCLFPSVVKQFTGYYNNRFIITTCNLPRFRLKLPMQQMQIVNCASEQQQQQHKLSLWRWSLTTHLQRLHWAAGGLKSYLELTRAN